jgi:hypothetical protein
VPQEAEVLVPPPSVFRIVTVAKFHGSLVVTLEQVESPLTYLALPPAPPAPAHVSPGESAVASPPAAAFPPPASAEPEDPDVVALGQSLKALGVGTSAACSNFAKSLAHQGILTVERLKKMPVHQAKKALEIVKMTEFQIEAIMEALAPPPAAATISPASSAPAHKPAIPTAQAASPAAPLHAKSGNVAPPTAQDKVLFSAQRAFARWAAAPWFHSPPPICRPPLLPELKDSPAFIMLLRAVTLGSCATISSPTPLLFSRKDSGMLFCLPSYFLKFTRWIPLQSLHLISLCTPSGETPLVSSSAKGHRQVCELLISCRAEMNAKDGVLYVALPSFICFKIYSMNPVSIVASNFLLHP